MLTSDFDYELPPELIASEPLADRSASRMMVVHRATGVIEHRRFQELSQYVHPGDLWVFNNTRVVLARFYSPDGKLEVLKLEALGPLLWRCMIRPGKKFQLGATMYVGDAQGRVIDILPNGNRIIEWDRAVDVEKHGHLALPHYMGRADRPGDRERYQTVFAEHEGSIAAPTAGLHFTPEVMKGLPRAFVTLHVGVGTFQPVKCERVADHEMHHERYEITADAAAKIGQAKRVVAVGTTACRTLESAAVAHGEVVSCTGETNIFMYPGYEFKVVDALLTNFHLPKSTLIMLVSAMAGQKLIMRAYAEAVKERYRFFSYGDCMLLI